MKRAQILQALQINYGALATALGITDLTTDYSPLAAAADRAARLMGVPATSAADDGVLGALDAGDWQDVAEVYVLRALQTAGSAGKVDIRVQNSSASGVQKAYSQLFTQVRDLLQAAEQSAGWKAYGGPRFEAGYLQLDYLEPSTRATGGMG
jgi:hypothetical protein